MEFKLDEVVLMIMFLANIFLFIGNVIVAKVHEKFYAKAVEQEERIFELFKEVADMYNDISKKINKVNGEYACIIKRLKEKESDGVE